MKFASLNDGSRDGQLLLVNRGLTEVVAVPKIAPTLQFALDNWERVSPALQEVSDALNSGDMSETTVFDPKKLAAPLPRAYQWADGSAYLNHVELVRKARGAKMPESFLTDPLMYQGGSDGFLGPCESIEVASEDYGIDFEAEVAVVTGDVPMGASAAEAGAAVRLLMLVNDVSLRNLIPAELGKGFGFFHSKPATAFSPVAVTPDELGQHWDGQRLHLPLQTTYNNAFYGAPNAGVDMQFGFDELIAHAAKTRHLASGTIIGSGTVSNSKEADVGSSCLAEKRMLEIIESGKPQTPFMAFGDSVRIEMQGEDGSIFGAIEQQVVPYTKS